MLVNAQVFVIAFLLGSGAIALWLDVRFEHLAPADLRRALLRTFIALAAAHFLFPPVWGVALERSPLLLALFAIAFPVLTYLLLSTIWSIKWLQTAMRGAR
jgi:hypothetical protein